MSQVTDDQVIAAVVAQSRSRQLPPPALVEAVEEAERVVGFPMPPLLRRLYLEVANGGFGDDGGVLGVRGGHRSGDWEYLGEIYEEGPDPSGEIPNGVVPLSDWGCGQWFLVDFRESDGLMWWSEEGEAWPQGLTLAQWLWHAVEGTLTTPDAGLNPASRWFEPGN